MFLLPLHRLNRPKIPRGRGLGQIPNIRTKQGGGGRHPPYRPNRLVILKGGDRHPPYRPNRLVILGGGGATPIIQTEQAGDTEGGGEGGGQTDLLGISIE